MPPGHEVSVSWKVLSPQLDQSFRVPHEGGFSSKRLVKAGQVWYLKEFYTPEGAPHSFRYGKMPAPSPEKPYKRVLQIWAHRDYATGVFDEEISEISKNATMESPEITKEQRDFNKKHNVAKSKQKFRELVNANNFQLMFTFTFAPNLNENVQDLRFCLSLDEQKDRKKVFAAWNKRLTFIRKKLAEQGRALKYVLVAEKHLGKKNGDRRGEKVGTYHLHMATDKPIDIHLLRKWWGYGIVHVKPFNERSKHKKDTFITDPGNYMAKYMEKDFDDARLHNMRSYTCSQNLTRPIPMRDEQAVAECIRSSDATCYTVYDAVYKGEYEATSSKEKPVTVTFFVRSRIFNFRSQKHPPDNRPSFEIILDKIHNTT